MNVQFKKGALELCVLGIVQQKDCYGYELTETISSQFNVSEGSIYTLLRRLTGEGYFTTYLVESTEGPTRKYYQLTDEGKHYYEQLKAEWHRFTISVNELIGGNTHE